MKASAVGGVGIRRAEIVGALSLATDLGLGQSLEHALRSAVLATRIARLEGMSPREVKDAFYLTMLMFLGCSSAAKPMQVVFGDEIAARGWLTPAFLGEPMEMMTAITKHGGDARDAILAGLPALQGTGAEQCEVGQTLARSLHLGGDVEEGLGQVFERWDGQGVPHGLRGEATLPAVRIARFARSLELSLRGGGIDAVVTLAKARAGGAYEPRLVERACARVTELLDGIEAVGWSEAIAAEPGPHEVAEGAGIDEALSAMGDFVDLKTGYFLGHSRAVAALATSAAQHCQLPEADLTAVRRAALVHDVGLASVSVRVWDKQGPLSDAEWERVRMHTYYTERILDRVRGLGAVVAIATKHHERQDGSGYHHRSSGVDNPPTARILAAADVYCALREARPHRMPHDASSAAAILEAEAHAGRLDAHAVQGVLFCAGHRARRPARSPAWPAGLTNREVEVLRLAARGLTNVLMASELDVSTSTIDHHLRHIYDKVGVSTRAAAALFASQHDLLSE